MPWQPSDMEKNFARYLIDRRDSHDGRAAMAALRRGLGRDPGTAIEMYQYLGRFLDDEPSWRTNAVFVVASLFGSWNERRWGPSEDGRSTNFGASLKRLAVNATGPGVERRLVAMLSADTRELPTHLRHLVAQCKGRDVPVDWAQMLHDLREWEWEESPAQRRWAWSFWHRQEADGGDMGAGPEELTNESSDTEGN